MEEIKGMWTASPDKANNPIGTWTENTRNVVICKDGKSIRNEDGFASYASGFPITKTYNGSIPLYNDEVIVFLKGLLDDEDEIGKIDSNGNYEARIIDNLGFSTDYPITGDKQYNIYNELEIVFNDGYNPTRLLNYDNLPFELDVNLALVDYTQLNNINIFPEVQIPIITVERVNSAGGSIETGVIYFSAQYEDFNGFLTNAFPITNPVLIIPIDKPFVLISGAEQKSRTTNSVEIKIDGLDKRFKKIRLIVVRKAGGQRYAEAFRTLAIKDKDSLTITYTGIEKVENVSFSELLVDRADYFSTRIAKASDGVLYLASPTVVNPPNIQKYVNNWKVSYVTDEVELNQLSGSLKDGKTFFLKKPFMHNEVYGLYAQVRMKSGNYGFNFHIPGRAPRIIQNFVTADKLENTAVTDLLVEAPYLAEDDKISPGNVLYYQTRDTSSVDGTLGFWENQNETYPETDDWDILDETGLIGTLQGEKVRHHKTPTIDTHGYADITTKKAPTLGFKISDIYLPDEIWEQIQDIEIFYAKRTGANSTLAGRSLVFMAATRSIDGAIATNAGNWDLHPVDGSGYSSFHITQEGEFLRFHPFDMLVDKTNILPTYIYNNKKFISDVHIEDVDPTGSMQVELDLTDPARTSVNAVLDENKLRAIDSQQYLPHNTIIGGGVNNRYAEEVFFARVKSPDVANPFSPMGLFVTDLDLDHPVNSYQPNHQTYLTDLCVWKEDAYLGFDEQEFVSTGTIIEEGDIDTGSIFGGDGYVGTQGLILTASNQNTFDDTDEHDAIFAKYKYYVETANAPELQYGDDFYPKNSDPITPGVTFNWQEFPIVYNKDYTSINDVNVVSSYDFEAQIIDEYYNRILRSPKAQREEKVSSWRTFLANDYYESARDRGRITNIEIMNGEVLIQHEYGLFITRGSETLSTDTSTVEVGSGDVFARPPKEILDSKNGYVGSSSQFNCLKGVAFYANIDDRQGKVFLIDDSLNEKSSEGMYEWFREHFSLNRTRGGDGGMGSLTNPYKYNGFNLVYDTHNKRIIISKKEKYLSEENEEDSLPAVDLSLTISYSLEAKCWVSMHDYIPDGIVGTANKVISFKGNGVFLHNVPTEKGKYYEEGIYKSYIEFVMNGIATRLYNSIYWKTQYIDVVGKAINESKTITSIMVYNHNQCSDILPITIMKSTRNGEGIWKFNNFRDLVKNPNALFLTDKGNPIAGNISHTKPFFKQSRFIGDYLCVRLIFDNLEIADLVISDVNVNDRLSYR